MLSKKEVVFDNGEEYLKNLVNKCFSFAEISKEYGFKSNPDSVNVIKKACACWGISCDFPHKRKMKNDIGITCHICGKHFNRKESKLKCSKSGLYFCSRECKEKAQSINGDLALAHYGASPNPEKKCIRCGKHTRNSSTRYCTSQCHTKHIIETKIESWLSGEWDGSKRSGTLSRTIRNYLIEKANNTCEKCGTKEWFGNYVPLEIHHKDGNSKNHNIDNLEVLCMHCHYHTGNYAGRKNGKKKK